MATKKAETAVEVSFYGGPVDGMKLRVAIPPSPRVRMVGGVNEWGTYGYDGYKSYTYIGTEWEPPGVRV